MAEIQYGRHQQKHMEGQMAPRISFMDLRTMNIRLSSEFEVILHTHFNKVNFHYCSKMSSMCTLICYLQFVYVSSLCDCYCSIVLYIQHTFNICFDGVILIFQTYHVVL